MKRSYYFGKPVQDVLYERQLEYDKKQIESVYGETLDTKLLYNEILQDIKNDICNIKADIFNYIPTQNFIIWYR